VAWHGLHCPVEANDPVSQSFTHLEPCRLSPSEQVEQAALPSPEHVEHVESHFSHLLEVESP
jgi:hypothetical protein